VKLEDIGNKYPSELSGGMQKRVGIARAIVMNPRYLFCDEPNSGLDPQTAIVIDQLISEISHEYNMTTIINTHDMNSVMAIGEKVVFLYEGKKEWEGSRENILHSDSKALNDFVFASEMAKMLKKSKF
jgi:phospholipid/cholesterol/gamma-HCH transport system ATP-binding protein